MAQIMYGPAIRDALATGDLGKMKAAAEEARQQLKDQEDLKTALTELEAAIAKLESNR